MKFVQRNTLSNEEKLQVLALWNHEYPKTLLHSSLASFQEYLNGLSNKSHILLVDEQNNIKGWYFDFLRENEKWFAIIVHTSLKGQGFGSKLLQLAKENNTLLNGWVIKKETYKKANGEIYKSPLAFYLKHKFIELSTTLSTDTLEAVKITWSKAT